MPAVITEEHMVMARTIRQCIALYNQNRELISIGAYQRGSDLLIDQALMIKPYIDEFTQQGMKEVVPFSDSLDGLRKLAMILIDDAKGKGAPQGGRMMPPPNRMQPQQGRQPAVGHRGL